MGFGASSGGQLAYSRRSNRSYGHILPSAMTRSCAQIHKIAGVASAVLTAAEAGCPSSLATCHTMTQEPHEAANELCRSAHDINGDMLG